MLHEFLLTHRDTIVRRAQERVASRSSPKPTDRELTNGIPVFLDQLGDALRVAKSSGPISHEHIKESAARHGRDLLHMGLTIAQVVHDYGDVCQVITELAEQQNAPLLGDEFRTLNLCLDDAIAEAVTEYTAQRERTLAEEGTERLGAFAHEMRNLLNTAMFTFQIIQSGRIAAGGSTGAVLGRSLMGMRALVDRSLVAVRLDAGLEHPERILVAEFVEEVELAGAMAAQARRQQLVVTTVPRTVAIDGDRQILAGALANMLQNAFKFTPEGGKISLTARANEDRVLFEVEDECGGLPAGATEDLFAPFEQRGADRSGVGLGLAICRKAATANGGELRVRDLPGKGCVFTLDLPKKPPPPLSAIAGGNTTSKPNDVAAGRKRRGT